MDSKSVSKVMAALARKRWRGMKKAQRREATAKARAARHKGKKDEGS
jgi:hypothetical protein